MSAADRPCGCGLINTDTENPEYVMCARHVRMSATAGDHAARQAREVAALGDYVPTYQAHMERAWEEGRLAGSNHTFRREVARARGVPYFEPDLANPYAVPAAPEGRHDAQPPTDGET